MANIEPPFHGTVEDLHILEDGFAALSSYKLCCTFATRDGIVSRKIMPKNEKVEGDVTSYFTKIWFTDKVLLVQRFCIFWHPLRVSVHNHGIDV